MTKEEILAKHGFSKFEEYDSYINTLKRFALSAMEEYGNQRFEEGQQSVIDKLPSDEEIGIESVNYSEFRWTEIDHLDTEAILNEGFETGAKWMKNKIGG